MITTTQVLGWRRAAQLKTFAHHSVSTQKLGIRDKKRMHTQASSKQLRRATTYSFRALQLFIGFGLTSSLLEIQSGKSLLDQVCEYSLSDRWIRTYRVAKEFVRLTSMYKWTQIVHGNDPNYADKVNECHRIGSERILKLCRVNGGIFVKVGQHAASLRPAIPENYIETLSCLQDQAKPDSLESVLSVIDEELASEGGVTNFSFIDPVPVGIASLAQVHRGILASDNTPVAIKVQHKTVEDDINDDFAMLRFLNKLAGKAFPNFSLEWALNELQVSLAEEIDFDQEARNAIRIRGLVRNNTFLKDRVWIPNVFEKLSTKRLLVMELVDKGIPIRQVSKLEGENISLSELRETVLYLFGRMFFNWGFIHCDPHPGNLMVVPPSSSQGCPKLALLDHGLYSGLDDERRILHCGLWKAIAMQDKTSLHFYSNSLGIGRFSEVIPVLLTNRPIESKARLGERVSAEDASNARATLKNVTLDDLKEDLPSDLLFVLRTMHLIKDLNENILKGDRVRRFNVYVECAVEGYWYGQNSTWGTYLQYLYDSASTQLRLEIYACLGSISNWWHNKDGNQNVEDVSLSGELSSSR